MVAHRINIVPLRPEEDILGIRLTQELSEEQKSPLRISTARSYLLTAEFPKNQLEVVCQKVLVDPVIQKAFVESYPAEEVDYVVEIRYKAGVTDNLARSAVKAILEGIDYNLKEEEIATSLLYFVKGSLSLDDLKVLFKNRIYNPLIEKAHFLTYGDFSKTGFSNEIESFHFQLKQKYETLSLNISDEALVQLSKDRFLFLSLEEMKVIKTYFGEKKVAQYRKTAGLGAFPTDVEMEMLAQTWSEHCKHKIFSARIEYTEKGSTETIDSLYRSYIKETTKKLMKKRPDLLSVFSDNAGVFAVENVGICAKVETHNSPSALDPYGGAMTGIVGVNRDIIGTGLGAKPLCNTDVFCFGDPHYQGKLNGNMRHPSAVFKGVHRGVKEGGNESGIPTLNGAMVFDDSFMGKPLVFCGSLGILPLKVGKRLGYKKYLQAGDLVVMAGGRVGLDGVHGATVSSSALTETSPTSSVQIGDPITQKRLLDFILEARDLELYNSITDNGAGGLSSSVGEMASQTGGCEIHLDKVLLKYKGLKPWEILVSESQERMTLAVPPEKWENFLSLANRREVEVCAIGTFDKSGFIRVFYEDALVAQLEVNFLHGGLPQMKLKAHWKQPVFPEPDKDFFQDKAPGKLLKILLRRPNIASKEKWVRQYDHEVKGQSVLKPFEGIYNDGPSDASAFRPLGLNTAIVVGCGLNPFYSQIDTYYMALCSADEAFRNVVCAGGDPKKMVCLDNFCWPDPIKSDETPDGEYKLAQLVRANKALATLCSIYEMPLISGKDSMKNDYQQGDVKISVLPTLLITALSTMEKPLYVNTSDLKRSGNLLYLLGDTKDELGASELYRAFGYVGNRVPIVDAPLNKRVYLAFHEASTRDLVESAHDLSEGGLAVALSEMCIGGRKGALVDLEALDSELDSTTLLFSESQGRIIVEILPYQRAAFEACFTSLPCRQIGEVTDEQLIVNRGEETLLEESVDRLAFMWQEALNF